MQCTIIVLKITLLHSVSIITNFVIPKRDKKNKTKKNITLFRPSEFWQFWGLYSHASAQMNMKFGTLCQISHLLGQCSLFLDHWVNAILAGLPVMFARLPRLRRTNLEIPGLENRQDCIPYCELLLDCLARVVWKAKPHCNTPLQLFWYYFKCYDAQWMILIQNI